MSNEHVVAGNYDHNHHHSYHLTDHKWNKKNEKENNIDNMYSTRNSNSISDAVCCLLREKLKTHGNASLNVMGLLTID